MFWFFAARWEACVFRLPRRVFRGLRGYLDNRLGWASSLQRDRPGRFSLDRGLRFG
jgi:hypothetical protein